MIKHRITLLGSQDRDLQGWLSEHPEHHERGAIILFLRLARKVEGQEVSDRFLAVEVIKMSDDWVLESSPTHLKINMRKFTDVYLRCEIEKLELGFVHNHPTSLSIDFSSQDDINERNILYGLSGCNGKESFLIAMLLKNGTWKARIRQGTAPSEIIPVRHISVISNNIKLHGLSIPDQSQEILKRQEAAFGKPFNVMLSSLRVAVIGLGGTGSSIATMLARVGVRELILIDGDKLEKTNLNRIHGCRVKDENTNKAKILADYIESLGLETSVSIVEEFLDESEMGIDALSSADVVFGCTDDQLGRDLMNQALYYYAQVYIDMGLTGFIDLDIEGLPYLRDHRGRISCILPEDGACLRCQRVISDDKIKLQQAIKHKPELAKLDSETLKNEFYLIGGGEQAPGVGPFTSATANIAVATFMNLLKPYRDISIELRQDNIWFDFVHMNTYSNEPIDNSECIYCRQHLLLVKSEGNYRLETPSYGKIKYD